jgi:cytochrome c oxidase subunit 2
LEHRRIPVRSGRKRAAVLLTVAVALGAGGVLSGCGDDAPAKVELSAAGQRGKAVSDAQGCHSCHTIDGQRSMGPSWQGLAGSEVQLADGVTVTADEAYLERAIRDPRSEVRAGFENLMPVAYGDLTDEELADLITYITEVSGS